MSTAAALPFVTSSGCEERELDERLEPFRNRSCYHPSVRNMKALTLLAFLFLVELGIC